MIDIIKLFNTVTPGEADKFITIIDARLEAVRDQNDLEERDIMVRRNQGAIQELRRLKTWLENRRTEKKNDALPPPNYFE